MSRVARVSIGLPVRNGALHLSRALDSLQQQTFEDVEIIVSDNASSDDTHDVCRHYADSDPRIRYTRLHEDVGLVRNYNRVVGLARGEYFKWATHDDWLEPEFISTCVNLLDQSPHVVTCSTGVRIHDIDGRHIDTWTPGSEFHPGDAVERATHLIRGLGEPYALYGLMRRDALARTPLMQSYLGSDRVLLLALAFLGEIRVLPDLLYHYTHHRPPDRSYSVYNDPANRGKLPLRTWVLLGEHLRQIARSAPSASDRLTISSAALRRYGLDSRRLLAAEAYHSAAILYGRARQGRRRGDGD